MFLSAELKSQHLEVTRRYFLQLGVASAVAFKIHSIRADSDQSIILNQVENGEKVPCARKKVLVECTQTKKKAIILSTLYRK